MTWEWFWQGLIELFLGHSQKESLDPTKDFLSKRPKVAVCQPVRKYFQDVVYTQLFKVKCYFRNSKKIFFGRCDIRFQLICNTIISVPCDPITVIELYDNLTQNKISFITTNHPRGLCPRRFYTLLKSFFWQTHGGQRYVCIEYMMDLYRLVQHKKK